jgi:CO/xanthine dehydrogenase Mo-binding subunit
VVSFAISAYPAAETNSYTAPSESGMLAQGHGTPSSRQTWYVLEVGYDRLAPRLDVDEVEVVLQIETRGPEHCGEVIGALRAAGYTLAFG